jgi:hypothetical protein
MLAQKVSLQLESIDLNSVLVLFSRWRKCALGVEAVLLFELDCTSARNLTSPTAIQRERVTVRLARN